MTGAVTEPGGGDGSHTQPLRIGLFGRLASGNLGNDATLDSVLGWLQTAYPNAILDAMSPEPAEVSRRYGFGAEELHWLHRKRGAAGPLGRLAKAALIGVGVLIDAWRTAHWVRRHDAVITPGMGVLEATLPVRPWQMPWSLYILTAAGRILRRPVAMVSVGASVVPAGSTRRLLVRAAERATYLSFRDEHSRDAMLTMGAKVHEARVWPDLVFGDAPTSCVSGKPGAVGVGVMDWRGTLEDRTRADQIHEDYVASMRQFVGWLVRTGHTVRLLVGDDVDQPVARRIRDGAQGDLADEQAAVVFEPCETFGALVEQIEQVELVVAVRFHNVIAAVSRERPTVAIGYGRKHDALMSDLGLSSYTVSIRNLEASELASRFSVAESNAEHIRGLLRAGNARNRDAVAEQLAGVASFLSRATTGKRRAW